MERMSRLAVFVILLAMLVPMLGVEAQQLPAAFDRTWERTDQPVASGQANRTWMWGPQAFTGVVNEPYAESPGGQRQVVYYDKSRMEITNPAGDQSSIWYVTNGLLSTELITGQMQTGNAQFENSSPAQVNIAGDSDDPTGPTYATFTGLLDRSPSAVGSTITQRVNRAGTTSTDSSLASQQVTVATVDDVTNHAIAAPFWEFMNASGTVFQDGGYSTAKLFENPFFATGRPITEAYWANVKVANTYRDVLLQCFERRCLTFTPGNPEGWQVEAGNVGQHYYQWRQQSAAALPQMTVHYIDVGQGDATLIQGHDFTILIDAGRFNGSEVVPYLQSVGVTSLDLLIGTHPDADHIGQIPQVMSAFDVAEVWMSGDLHTSQTFENAIDAILASDATYREPRAGEVHTFGDLRLEVVHPATLGSNFNDNSVSVRAVYGGIRFMLPGDAEAAGESKMVARGNLSAQILKVGHHGSSTSSTQSFVNAVNPEVAIYSASATNAFGHPAQSVIDRLIDSGATVYGTDVNGTVRVVTDGVTYSVLVGRGGPVQGGTPAPPPPPPAAPTPTPTPVPPAPPPPPPPPPPSQGCVNINTASFQELQRIIHIGPDRAQQIINLRPFSSVNAMDRISGIGPARLADIKAQGLACV